jgi:hypothetical protein
LWIVLFEFNSAFLKASPRLKTIVFGRLFDDVGAIIDTVGLGLKRGNSLNIMLKWDQSKDELDSAIKEVFNSQFNFCKSASL